ncbi:MAG TPA: tetratricopeptide repeat protein [Blastocatellia bacterium]
MGVRRGIVLLVLCLGVGTLTGPASTALSRRRLARYRYAQGLSYLDDGNYPKAGRDFMEACELDEHFAQAYCKLGETFIECRERPWCKELGEIDLVRERAAFERAIEIDPNCADAYVDLGDTFLLDDSAAMTPYSFEKAQALYRAAIGVQPTNPRGWHGLANSYVLQGQDGKCLEVLRNAVSVAPEAPLVNGLLYQLCIWDHPCEPAIEIMKESVRRLPKDTRAWSLLGVAYDTSECYWEAVDAFSQVVKLDPDDSEALLNLGESYASLGQFKAAQRVYDSLERMSKSWLVITPTNLGAELRAGELLSYIHNRQNEGQ